MRIDLVFDSDCPNVPAARAQLAAALRELGREPTWREIVSDGDDVPDYARGYGSPTILVDQRDVAGASPGEASCCRLYHDAGQLTGVPSVQQILTAIRSR